MWVLEPIVGGFLVGFILVGFRCTHFRAPILVVGSGCSLGANQDFDPWPHQFNSAEVPSAYGIFHSSKALAALLKVHRPVFFCFFFRKADTCSGRFGRHVGH